MIDNEEDYFLFQIYNIHIDNNYSNIINFFQILTL